MGDVGPVGHRRIQQGTSHRVFIFQYTNRARFCRECANMIPAVWLLDGNHKAQPSESSKNYVGFLHDFRLPVSEMLPSEQLALVVLVRVFCVLKLPLPWSQSSRTEREPASSQVINSPNFIKQTAHCDHNPRAGGLGVCASVATPAFSCRLG